MRLLRRIALFAALPAVLAAAACDDPVVPEQTGEMTGQLDGAPWSGDAEVMIRGDTVSVFSSRTADGLGRHLAFFAIAEGPGEYPLLTAESRYDETVGGDVITYSAAVTAGTITFSSLSRSDLLASGTISGVTLQGTRGTSTFSQGSFTGIVTVLR